MEFNFDYFKNMEPMKYYDCAGAFEKPKAQEMLNNKDNAYIATCKNDGEWAMFIKGINGEILIRSRSLSVVTGEYGDKTAHLPHLVEDMKKWPNGSVVLGELCFEDPTMTSKDVGTILRCLAPKAIERQKGNPLIVKLFDLLAWESKVFVDKPYGERFAELQSHFLKTSDLINFVQYEIFFTITGFCYENFMEYADRIWAIGGEGIVIHGLNFPYEPGKRTSWHSLKVKKTLEDFEVPVLGIEEPTKIYDGKSLATWLYYGCHKNEGWPEEKYMLTDTGRQLGIEKIFQDCFDYYPITKFYYYGWPGAIKVDYNGKQVSISSGLSDSDREWLASDEGQEKIEKGLIAVISGMEQTADGSIRHPVLVRLRTDL